MATQLVPTSTPDSLTVAAVQHLQQTVLPTLPEPQNGALTYGLLIGANPSLDARFCEVAGKVVHVTANFSEKVETVALRGEGPGLKWDADYASDVQVAPNFYERTFTFHVPVANMNDKIEMKIVSLNAEGKISWQNSNNIHIDLSAYGHIVNVKVNAVSFS
jgi:hypothetical protein